MKLKLKEDPREWQKFAVVMAVLFAAMAVGLRSRQVIAQPAFAAVLILLAIALVVCWIKPVFFRGFYRHGMTISFHFGQVMGRIILSLFFLAVITPMGLLLRIFGKDLLNMKRRYGATSYWSPAKTSTRFDRQF